MPLLLVILFIVVEDYWLNNAFSHSMYALLTSSSKVFSSSSKVFSSSSKVMAKAKLSLPY